MSKKYDKVFLVTYGNKTKLYKSEETMIRSIRNKKGVKVLCYSLDEETTSDSINERLEGEYKSLVREQRLSTILDGDENSEASIHFKIVDKLENFDDKKSKLATWKLGSIIKKTLDAKADMKVMKSRFLNNKNYLLLHVFKTVEDYELLLKYHNFRHLPKSVVIKENIGYERLKGKYVSKVFPDNFKNFKIAKERQKNGK